MSAVYAINDFRRGVPAARGRARHSGNPAPPAGPPPLLAAPRQIALFAVPGRAEFRMGPDLVSITADAENCVPGTVAGRVICTLCEATWTGEFLQDGRPVYSGGVALTRRFAQDGSWRFLALRCRCDAGQRLPLRDMDSGEWRRFVRWRLLRVRRAIRGMTDAHVERYLIDPRGPAFAERWHFHLARYMERGRAMAVAKRMAYMRAFKEEFRP